MTRVLRRLPEQPIRQPLVAVGNFDGVHRGHQAIIAQATRRAGEIGGTSVVLTFDPHPVSVLRPETPFALLTTLDQKVDVMTKLGVDVVVVLPFTLEFSRRSAEQFVREDLGERLGAREVYVGRNFAFGKGREGDVAALERFGESLGMRVVVQPPVLVGETMVSSSAIRRLLREGRVAEVSELLGRPYATDGVVTHGDGRGRALGYPTANIRPGEQMLPQIGIYAAVVDDVTSGERGLDAVVYLGSQPTFGAHTVQLEAHVFGSDRPRYEHRLRIAFIDWVRGEERFASAEALVAQIARDVAGARAVLAARTGGPGARR
ncbi:MAG: bifunctional riboflavin kinase/FAD synthetase [Nitrospirae bacterium]|nr:bifunctional riboflavin kinase/FAD synthetase [Nitrospirota bacterium]